MQPLYWRSLRSRLQHKSSNFVIWLVTQQGTNIAFKEEYMEAISVR
jgi:hypothetical protein